jgi:hypothetical protein
MPPGTQQPPVDHQAKIAKPIITRDGFRFTSVQHSLVSKIRPNVHKKGKNHWIAAGPDGNLWFTENSVNQIGRITTTGAITQYPAPTANSVPNGITTGPDGNLWFTEGNANQIVKAHIGPRYNVCLLYDPTRAVRAGSTVPMKLQLCNISGDDLSSSSITVHAISVTQTSTSISGPVQDSGNANPDNDFRFDSTLGGAGGYILNLSTVGLTTGTYNLNFTVTGDSAVYAAPFQVK